MPRGRDDAGFSAQCGAHAASSQEPARVSRPCSMHDRARASSEPRRQDFPAAADALQAMTGKSYASALDDEVDDRSDDDHHRLRPQRSSARGAGAPTATIDDDAAAAAAAVDAASSVLCAVAAAAAAAGNVDVAEGDAQDAQRCRHTSSQRYLANICPVLGQVSVVHADGNQFQGRHPVQLEGGTS